MFISVDDIVLFYGLDYYVLKKPHRPKPATLCNANKFA